MAAKPQALVAFDVLLRGAAGDVPPTVKTIDQFRPPDKAIEFCIRWLSRQGAKCHRTDFSLACEMPVADFERLFDVKLKPSQKPARSATARSAGAGPAISVPAELAEYVEQVSITPQPELFA